MLFCLAGLTENWSCDFKMDGDKGEAKGIVCTCFEIC